MPADPATGGCPDAETLAALTDGTLPETETLELHRHVSGCSACRLLLGGVVRSLAVDATVDAAMTPPVLAAERLPVVGELVLHYRIEERIGEGGMGVVFRATDVRLRRRVAIKFISPRHGADEQARARFRREAQAASTLEHDHIGAIHDVGEHQGLLFIAMAFLDGETLQQRLARGPLPPREAAILLEQAARALAAAHQASVIHRDVKPANLFLTRDGPLKLLDFGVAKLTDPDLSDLTRSGELVGTVGYMAPEQLRGGAVDARMDQWSLGVVAYEAVTGVRPFGRDSTAATIQAILDEEPAPLRQHNPAAPAAIDAIIGRCLAKDPRDRYPGATELAADLRRFLDGEAVQARSSTWRRRWRGRARRWRPWLVAAGFGALALGAVGAQMLRRSNTVRGPWQPTVEEMKPSYQENADSPTFSPDGAWLAYSAEREGGWRIYVAPAAGGATPRAVTPPEHYAMHPRWTEGGRALVYTDRRTTLLLRVRLDGGAPEALVTGSLAGAGCGDGTVHVSRPAPGCEACERLVLRDAAGAEREIFRTASDERVTDLKCDRAGRHVAFTRRERSGPASPSDVWIANTDGAPARALTTDHLGNQHPAFAPDGDSVVYSSSRGGHLHLWEARLEGLGAALQLTSGEGPDTSPDVSPDGRRLVYQTDLAYTALQAQPLDGSTARRVTQRLVYLQWLNVTPDGQDVIAEATENNGRVSTVAISVADGADRTLAECQGATLVAGGDEVICAVVEGGRSKVVAVPRRGGPARTVTEVEGRIAQLDAPPDGTVRLLRNLAGELRAWRAPLAGGAAVEHAPRPWISVEKSADAWTVAGRGTPASVELRFLPPGQALEGGSDGARKLSTRWWKWYQDRRAILYWNGTQLRRHVVATGEDTFIVEGGAQPLSDFTVSPDGRTVYRAFIGGLTRRFFITNFSDRARP